MGKLLSTADAAEQLGVSLSTLRNYIRDGRLPVRRIRGSRLLRIEEAALAGLLEGDRDQNTADTED